MKTHRTSHATRLALLTLSAAFALVAGLVPACGNSNPAPPGTGGSTGSTSTGSTSTGSTSTSTGTGGTSTTTTSTTGIGGAAGTGGSSAVDAGDGGDAAPPCVSDGGATGCYSCPPTTTNEFLNQCASSTDQCTHFDNTTLLPFWDGGALPAP